MPARNRITRAVEINVSILLTFNHPGRKKTYKPTIHPPQYPQPAAQHQLHRPSLPKHQITPCQPPTEASSLDDSVLPLAHLLPQRHASGTERTPKPIRTVKSNGVSNFCCSCSAAPRSCLRVFSSIGSGIGSLRRWVIWPSRVEGVVLFASMLFSLVLVVFLRYKVNGSKRIGGLKCIYI